LGRWVGTFLFGDDVKKEGQKIISIGVDKVRNMSVSKKITGYRIVGEEPYVPVPVNPPELAKHGIFYRGFDRKIIDEFMDDYFEKKLTEEISKIWYEMCEHEFGPSGWELTKKFSDAVKILQYCRNKNKTKKSEIITIYCEDWEKDEESVECFQKLEFLGYDVTFRDAYYSTILIALFFRPEYFQKFIPMLNEQGLFVDKSTCYEYTEVYRPLARKNIVESADCESEMQIVEVCRVTEVL
jgi:hypothetical protein